MNKILRTEVLVGGVSIITSCGKSLLWQLNMAQDVLCQKLGEGYPLLENRQDFCKIWGFLSEYGRATIIDWTGEYPDVEIILAWVKVEEKEVKL
jgi:hypothetical protein